MALERREILIWGKTRPELSQKHREVVCTGGVFRDTGRLVRLYPIPLRFLDDEHVFRKYQWITADVERNQSDPRPESYRVRSDTIAVGEQVDTDNGTWRTRASWVLAKQNLVTSVEDLQARHARDHTSLGVMRPRLIEKVTAEPVPPGELAGFVERYAEALKQCALWEDQERDVEPLRPSDYRFKVHFRCDDAACLKGHTFSVLDWEADAAYSRMRAKLGSPYQAAEKVRQSIEDRCGSDHDMHFFLGNISNHPQVFTIVGLWYPKRDGQLSLPLGG